MTLVALDPLEYALPAAFADRVRETAISASRRAGAIQLHHFRNTTVRCTRLLHDLKLETDTLCESAIIAAIREHFPDHAILTEESGQLPGSGEYTWIIDPLDGTVNFWHGLPFFCVSIACYRKGGHGGLPGAPVAGVVFLPFSQELFVGLPGLGASMNGRPIRVSGAERTRDAVVTVSFGKTPDTMRRMTRKLDVLLPQVRKARCLGAVAAELAYVAAGFLGGLIYEGIKLWDFAAGKIILEQAGGFLEAEETEPDQWRVLAGAPGLRQAFRKMV
ncbi:MAG TPA: inositol monophosphatase family protein [Desulfobacterales bacterium]|nr:inositol monophosphatase family protein [Desulfobacterales bacterium]